MLVLESDEETRAQSNVAICQITVQPGDRGRGRAPARLVWSGPRARPVVTQAQGPGAGPPAVSLHVGGAAPPPAGPPAGLPPRPTTERCPQPGRLGLSVACSEGPLPAAGPPLSRPMGNLRGCPPASTSVLWSCHCLAELRGPLTRLLPDTEPGRGSVGLAGGQR